MSFVYTEAKNAIASGTIDFANDDIRCLLLMDTTTATGVGSSHSNQEDVNKLDGFTILAEFDGSNYVRAALSSGQAVNEDTTNDRAEFDANDITWSSLGAPSSGVVGLLVYKHIGASDSQNIPIAMIDSGFPVTVSANSDLSISWNAQGIIQVT